MPTWLLVHSGGLAREGLPPGRRPPLCPLRPLPVLHPHPSPAAPTQAAPSPTATSPQHSQPVTPKLAAPSPPHSSPLPGTLGSSGTPQQPLRLLRAASAPLSPPPASPKETPVKRSPHPRAVSLTASPPAPPSPGSSCGPQATSWRRHCPPGAVSWKGHGGEGGQRCPQVPEEYEETHAWIWSLEAPPHSTRLTHRGVAPHPQASQVRPESPSPEAHSQRGPPPGALLRREDTRPASQTAGALASPSDLFHLGLSRQMDRVLWGWALRTRNASADQYSISWANLCLQSDCLSSTSSNITALLSAFKASEELASHRRTNLVFYFISHQFTEQVGGPHPCQFPH